MDVVESIAGAIYAIQAAAYDLLILDRRLPDGDGVQILDQVRENRLTVPVMCLTARSALDERVAALNGREMQQRILKSLGIEDAEIFVRDVDRPNIALLRWRCAADRRAGEIASLLRVPQLQGQKAMVFVPSTKVGEELQAALRNLGLDVPLYHSKLGNAWERQELVKRFLGQSRPPVDQIICTNAFGMGLDVPNVRLVIHWQQSASVERSVTGIRPRREGWKAFRGGHVLQWFERRPRCLNRGALSSAEPLLMRATSDKCGY